MNKENNVRVVMEKSFIDYAMSVITDRALPDVRDGLKPVHRRILFAMFEAGNTHNKGYKKSARMVGDVIGKYHPHGDSSVYGAAVRMAQPFSMYQPLIDGQGNFGSIDGDNPAAMRYTEMRMSRIAGEMFDDIYRETVEFRPNYDGNENEPVILTAPFPNLLVNGVDGIAVGMATSIPPHNLRSVIDSTLRIIDEPDVDATVIASILKAPDFPTQGVVHDLGGFMDAVTTGRGKVKLRSRWHEEPRNRGASSLVVTEIPFQVNKANLVEKIALLVNEKKVEDIVAMRDESDKDGIRVVMDIRAGASAEVIFSQLVAMTDLETSISYNCVALDQGTPRLMGLMEIIQKWLEFRKDVVHKRYVFNRKQLRAKLHILEGFIAILSQLDRAIKIIRDASTPADAKAELMNAFGVDDAQAQSVLDMRLQKLTGMEIDAIRADHMDTIEKVAALTEVIESPERIVSVIRQELVDIEKRYGGERRTEINMSLSSVQHEDLIEREDVLIVVTRNGYIKRLPASSLGEQNRRTRGKRIVTVGDDDEVSTIFQCNSHDHLMVFSQSGQVYSGRAFRMPEGTLISKGRHIRNVIDGLDEEISAMLAIPDKEKDMTIVTVTKNAQVKRTSIDDYTGANRKGGIRGVTLDEGDALVNVFACRPYDHMMLVCDGGRAIRFDIEDVRTVGRSASGVRGMRLDNHEVLVGAYVIQGQGEPCPFIIHQQEVDGVIEPVRVMDTSHMDAGRFLVCVGDRGVGKRTSVSEFGIQARGGKGMAAMKLNNKTGKLIAAVGATLENDLVMFASNGVSNRIWAGNVQESGRATSGSYLMNLDANESVVSVTLAAHQDDIDTSDQVE